MKTLHKPQNGKQIERNQGISVKMNQEQKLPPPLLYYPLGFQMFCQQSPYSSGLQEAAQLLQTLFAGIF